MVGDEIQIINTLRELKEGIKESRIIMRRLGNVSKDNKTNLRSIIREKKLVMKIYKERLKELLDTEVYWVQRNCINANGKYTIRYFEKLKQTKNHYLLFYNEVKFVDYILAHIVKSINYIVTDINRTIIPLINTISSSSEQRTYGYNGYNLFELFDPLINEINKERNKLK